MKLYSYVVKHDTGFAPNPSGAYCTLACCKPKIRKGAEEGDWVVGTGSKNTVGQDKLVYAMRITKKLPFEEYGRDKRFSHREDSIYYEEGGQLKQKEVFRHDDEGIKHDLEGEYVLISEKGEYSYFGRNAIPIPEHFRKIIKKGPAHKCNFDEEFVRNFLQWVEDNCKKGKCGEPYVKVLHKKCLK